MIFGYLNFSPFTYSLFILSVLPFYNLPLALRSFKIAARRLFFDDAIYLRPKILGIATPSAIHIITSPEFTPLSIAFISGVT